MRTKEAERLKAEKPAKEGRRVPAKNAGRLFGKGRDLWGSDRELDEFLAGIYQRRREDARA